MDSLLLEVFSNFNGAMISRIFENVAQAVAGFDSVGPLHDCFSRALLFHYMLKPSFPKILKYQEVTKDTLEGLVKKSPFHMRSHILSCEIIFLSLMILFYVS